MPANVEPPRDAKTSENFEISKIKMPARLKEFPLDSFSS
jgi:hypothetical protein